MQRLLVNTAAAVKTEFRDSNGNLIDPTGNTATVRIVRDDGTELWVRVPEFLAAQLRPFEITRSTAGTGAGPDNAL